MKPPDRLLHDLQLFQFMLKFWLALPVALAVVLAALSAGDTLFDLWRPLVRFAVLGASGLCVLAVVAVGGKLFVTLIQWARRKP